MGQYYTPTDETRAAAHRDAMRREGSGKVSLKERCLTALTDAILTADEVAEKIGASVLAVRPRMTELAAKGLIDPTAFKRKNSSGKQAVVWMLAA